MTLGRLIELYKAEQEGKQIMLRVEHVGYLDSHKRIDEVKLSKFELKDLILDEEDDSYFFTFFIKNEEDENGNKIK